MLSVRFSVICILCLLVVWPGLGQETDSGKTRTILHVSFEDFKTTDWGIGHLVNLPKWKTGDTEQFMHPRNDGGDWLPFYWEKSDQARKGHSMEIRLVCPSGSDQIRGCGVDMVFKGPTALPPDKTVTVSVWTNCARHDEDFTTVVLGWQPGDFKGTFGGIQEYVKISQRVRESGWKLQQLTFRSNKDPNVGDIVGLAFAGKTGRALVFQKDPKSPKGADCHGWVAVEPVLSAFFDELTITVEE